MIKNYFKTALRNIWKYKATGFINLFGLAIGMTAAVLIFIWVRNEITVDKFQPNQNNIYRITNTIHVSKTEDWVWESSPLLLSDFALKEIPEVQKVARLRVIGGGNPVFNVNQKLFSEKKVAIVEKSWFNMFSYKFISGSVISFAQHPFSVILTESKARQYFGNSDAVGQIISMDSVNYTVQAVVKDNPLNSSFQFDIFLQLDGHLTNPDVSRNDHSWGNFSYISFLEVRDNANAPLVAKKLNAILDKNRTTHNDLVSLQSLAGMYFEKDLQSSQLPHGNKAAVYIFTLFAILLLVTACINYVNLTTARASLRAKEISVRKIIGAERKQLFMQFISESLLVSFLALTITFLLLQLTLPLFNTLTEKHFILPVTSGSMWEILFGTLLVATLLNGIYPAMLLSNFKPMSVFRGKTLLQMNDVTIRKGLVVFQFVLSIALITSAIVIYRQLKFIQTSDPGYNVAQIISLQVPNNIPNVSNEDQRKSILTSFKADLKSQSVFSGVASGDQEIFDVGNASSGNANWAGRDTTFNPTIAITSADFDFQNMFQVKLKDGHWFRRNGEDKHNYIINETAAGLFKMEKPVIGDQFIYGGDTGRIIGIAKDFHYKNLHEKIGALVITASDSTEGFYFLKVAPGNIPKAIAGAETLWAKYFPTEPFSYTFMDDRFESIYKDDLKTSSLVFIFSLIAIVIAASGLFGLTALTAEQRTKEIGIRKVLGASVQQVTILLSRDFVKLVLIAIAIASPIAWWSMNKWLETFAYRIHFQAWILILAGVLGLLMAVLAVSLHAFKAAIANPVKSLRSE